MTSIEWTEATWSPVRMRDGTAVLIESNLTPPLRRRKPTRYQVAGVDIFDENISTDWIDQVFAVMALAPHHTFQVLTKQSARMRAYLHDDDTPDRIGKAQAAIDTTLTTYERLDKDALWPLNNVWIGVSVEDQTRANERIPDLLATPAAIRFVSAEPLIGPVNLTDIEWPQPLVERFAQSDDLSDGLNAFLWYEKGTKKPAGLDWVIVGGESGPNARPMHPDWVRSVRDQCAAAQVPFFFKQWGEWAPGISEPTGTPGKYAAHRPHDQGRWSFFDEVPRQFWVFGADARMSKIGKRHAGRLLDGIEHNAMPERAP